MLNHTYALPGIGSYVAAAIKQGSLGKVGIAIGVEIVMVIGVNVVFWRPMVAWAERFRAEGHPTAADRPRSVVLDLLRRSSVPDLVARPLRPVGRALDRVTRPFGLAEHPWAERFRTEESAAAERPRSMVLGGLRRSSVPDLVARPARPACRWTGLPGRSAWPSTRCSARRCAPALGTCSSSARSALW